MSKPTNADQDPLADSPGTEDLCWPDEADDDEAQMWRDIATPLVSRLVDDPTAEQVLYSPRFHLVGRNLTQCLVLERTPTRWSSSITRENIDSGEIFSRAVHGQIKDIRAVVTLLARARAQFQQGNPQTIPIPGIATIGSSLADSWLRAIVSLVWFDLKRPAWLPASLREFASDYREDLMHEGRYRPWLQEKDEGLQGDLVNFLRTIKAERAARQETRLIESTALLNACVLLRALAAVAPERISVEAFRLVEETEAQLDVSMMDVVSRGLEGDRVQLEEYRSIRSACDQQTLRQSGGAADTAGVVDTPPPARKRSL